MYFDISLVKKSLYDYIVSNIHNGTSYIIGTGTDQLSIVDSYPIDPTGLHLPTLSMDIGGVSFKSDYELGGEVTHFYDIDFDLFARTNLEREQIMGNILKYIEATTIPFYNYSNNGSTNLVSTLKTVAYDGAPIRILTPSQEEKYKFSLTATFKLVK